MKNLTNQFVRYYENSEEFQRRLHAYDKLIKTNEFEFFRDTLVTIQGTMMLDLLSNRIATLSKEEKDVIQRTYYNVNQILDYLSNPRGWIRRKSRFSTTDLMKMVNSKFTKGKTNGK